MHIRVSTTTIETFRKYRDYDFVPESDLISNIKGEFEWRDEMRWGDAFHRILENPDEFRVEGGYVCEGFSFKDETVEPCLAIFNRDGVFEVKHTKDYTVHGYQVTVVAKIDQGLGARVIENKTKWSAFDISVYRASCQWRWYAVIFDAVSVTYNVFLLHRNKKGEFILNGIETFTEYPYPGIEHDCLKLLGDFVDYVKVRGLEAYLQADRYKRSA